MKKNNSVAETIFHQQMNTTCYDRYPAIFHAAQQYCKHRHSTAPILSYGCSTGEECFTLKEKYFPDNTIVGADIDEKNLQTCHDENKHSDIEFLYSNFNNLIRRAPYQAIFCMSVLCRWPASRDVMDISPFYTFEMFESTLCELDSMLELGGILIIYNSSFRFSDTLLYSRYQSQDEIKSPYSGVIPKFGRDNLILKDMKYSERIFIKKLSKTTV